MRRRVDLVAAACAAALLISSLGASEWVEVCAPGRPGGLLGVGTAEGSRQAVVDLVPFDGRLYVHLLPPAAEEEAVPIVSYRHDTLDVVTEVESAGRLFGRWRVIGDELCVPVRGGKSGFHSRAKGGDWSFTAFDEGTSLSDVIRFDGRIFVAGRRGDAALVMWRDETEREWRVEDVNRQAARFSYRADRFLAVPDHMSLILVRDVIGEWPRKCAPPDWGAWYLLHYHPEHSARGFLFDGQPRPLPVLRALCPGSRMHNNTGFRLSRDVCWKDGLLYVVLGESGLMCDEDACLYYATLKQGNPQEGTTFFARRVEGTDTARDVAVEGDTCWVLLAGNTRPQGRVVKSSDLENWHVVYNGAFGSAPICLAVMNGNVFVGLDDGSIVMVKE